MSHQKRVESSYDLEKRLLKERDEVVQKYGSSHPYYNRLSVKLSAVRHPEKASVRQENWSRLNPEKFNAYLERRRNSPEYKGKIIVRNVVRSGLKIRRTVHGRKIDDVRFEKFLGCTVEEFHKYIEGQFVNGMNWNNRCVKWVHRFRLRWDEVDFSTEEGQKKMAHFSNIKLMEIVEPEPFE